MFGTGRITLGNPKNDNEQMLLRTTLLVLVEPFYGGSGGAVFLQPDFGMGQGPGDDGNCGKFYLNKVAHSSFSNFLELLCALFLRLIKRRLSWKPPENASKQPTTTRYVIALLA